MGIKDTIQQPEGRRLEFKQELPTVSDLSKTIIAFANDAGGVLYIGVKDNPREIVGVKEDDLMQIEEQISSLIYDNCSPIIIPEISVVNVDGLYLLKVQVFRGNNRPYFLKQKGKLNGTFIRVGSNNRVATEEIIAELERQKRNISFDAEVFLENDLHDINIDKFKKLFHEKTDEEISNATLKKLNLTTEYNSTDKPTNALILFSDGDLKNKYFPYAKIECARFKGTSTDVFIDQKTLDSNIVQQTEEAYEFVLRHINKGAKVEGVYTKTRWEYPVKAIREVIRNAVVHRDYSLSGKDIKIAIYDDMIEITSPGNLLPSIDFNKMEARQSDVRNKTIAPVFKKMGLIDQWGNGLKLITDELKQYSEIKLEWFERSLQFQVQFVKTDYQLKDSLQKTKVVENPYLNVIYKYLDQLETKSKPTQKQIDKYTADAVELTNEEREVLLFSLEVKKKKEILEDCLGISSQTKNYQKYIVPLLEKDFLQLTIKDKPNSRLQKYFTTNKGRIILKIIEIMNKDSN